MLQIGMLSKVAKCYKKTGLLPDWRRSVTLLRVRTDQRLVMLYPGSLGLSVCRPERRVRPAAWNPESGSLRLDGCYASSLSDDFTCVLVQSAGLRDGFDGLLYLGVGF
jgi:hypothetical protein